MDKLELDVVDVSLVEPDHDTRQSIRNILYDTGFRNLRLGGRLTELRDALAVSMPALLISETELPDGDFCELVHAVRHHEIGTNPFLPVIALTGNPAPDTVKKVIERGADALLAKPLAAQIALLVDKIVPDLERASPVNRCNGS